MHKIDRNDPNSYYHFNDEKREISILRYDTPMPWMNYFSNGTFHTLLSQAGGGVAFHRSPQIWRLNRYRFFHLPTDRSGFYYYLRDRATGKYWCPTAEPAFTKPQKWKAFHGLGYTRFEAEHEGLHAELCYFVGPDENALIWDLNLTNNSSQTKEIDVFAYVEFGMLEFMRELSWFCYNKHQIKVDFDEKLQTIIYHYAVEMQPKPSETPLVYLATDIPLSGFDCDRDEFIGNYRSESNPLAIEDGKCTNSTLNGGDPCGALEMSVTLAPGESRRLKTILGTTPDLRKLKASLGRCRESGFIKESLAKLSQNWEEHLSRFVCQIPDVQAQRQINIWNPYQAQRNLLFSRNISFYATGTFRGTGFRDSAQDVLAMTSLNNREAQSKLRELLAQQYKDGHVNHYYFPHEGWVPVNRIHSDNHIWPIFGIWSSVVEDGHYDFLSESIPYYDGGQATVYEHLRQSVQFTLSNIGANGFPLMLHSDWNDMLYKVGRNGKGESIWMSMMLGFALPKLAELARLLGRESDAREYEVFWRQQKVLVNTKAWDGKWFRRAILDNGEYLGTHKVTEAQIWLNAQTWSVISGMADDDKALLAMDSTKDILDTDLGLKKLHPPIVDFPTPDDPLSHYNPGCGENGSIFCHANTWAIIAECILGRGDIAWKYYRQLIPSIAMNKSGAWRYKAEPYVYSSNLFGPDSDKFGLANVSWLTGTASWMYVAATQYILGIRASWKGLIIDPCIPSVWNEFRVTRQFRGCRVEIEIRNPTSVCKGVSKLTVEGYSISLADGPLIPTGLLAGKAEVKVVVEMGREQAKHKSSSRKPLMAAGNLQANRSGE